MAGVTLKQAHAFVAVARYANFRRAADRLAVSQSSITVQVRELEDRIGVPLLERTTRSVRLTPAGEELLPEFERLIGMAARISAKGAQLASGRSGQVRVGTLPSIAAEFLPAVLAGFRTEYPYVHLEILEAVEQELVSLVKQRKCDLALTSAGMLEPGLHFEPLFSDDLVAVMPAAHPLARADAVSLRDLARDQLILTRWGTSLRLAVEQAFDSEQLKIAPAFEVIYLSTAVGFAQKGLGIALVPATTAAALDGASTVARPLANRAGSRMMGILRVAGARGQPLLQRFCALLCEGLGAAQTGGG